MVLPLDMKYVFRHYEISLNDRNFIQSGGLPSFWFALFSRWWICLITHWSSISVSINLMCLPGAYISFGASLILWSFVFTCWVTNDQKEEMVLSYDSCIFWTLFFYVSLTLSLKLIYSFLRSTEKPCCKSNWVHRYDDWLFFGQCTSAKRIICRWMFHLFSLECYFMFPTLCRKNNIYWNLTWNRWGGKHGCFLGITFVICHHWCRYIRWQWTARNGCRSW